MLNIRAYESVFGLMWGSTLPCHANFRDPEFSMLKRCRWKGERISCSAIFTMFPTDRGMCCTFNMDAADKIFKESR